MFQKCDAHVQDSDKAPRRGIMVKLYQSNAYLQVEHKNTTVPKFHQQFRHVDFFWKLHRSGVTFL